MENIFGVPVTVLRAASLSSGTAVSTIVISNTATTGAVTTQNTSSSFIDTGLSNVNTYLGRTIRFTSGTCAGQSRLITTYVVASQTITVTPAFSATPQNGDTYSIDPIIPDAVKWVYVVGMTKDAGGSADIPQVVCKMVQSNGVQFGWGIASGNAGGSSTNLFQLNWPVRFPVVDGAITLTITPGASYTAVNQYYVQLVMA